MKSLANELQWLKQAHQHKTGARPHCSRGVRVPAEGACTHLWSSQ